MQKNKLKSVIIMVGKEKNPTCSESAFIIISTNSASYGRISGEQFSLIQQRVIFFRDAPTDGVPRWLEGGSEDCEYNPAMLLSIVDRRITFCCALRQYYEV